MATRPGPFNIDDVRYILGPDGTGTPKTVTPCPPKPFSGRRRFPVLSLLLVLLSLQLSAEPLEVTRIRQLTQENTAAALNLYREFLRLPNDALYPQDIMKLLSWLEGEFTQRGFSTRRIATAGSPLLLAERLNPGAEKTVLVYLQADGQPVDPAAWEQPNPFEPTLKEEISTGQWEKIPWDSLNEDLDQDWRIFARSAADSKGPMTQFMIAVENLDRAGYRLPYNLKVIIDTEEELGSPNLPDAVNHNRDVLAADMLLIFDGPPHASNKPTVVFGARGIMTVQLVTYGPVTPQHSGHYGNYAPNPALRMAQILGSMKSDTGRVLLAGFYDGVRLDTEIRNRLAQVPDDEPAIKRRLGIAETDQVGASLQEAIQYPSLNIRGLSAGWVNQQARTIIPATATAELDIRLVKESDPQRLLGLLRKHIESLGYTILERAPTTEQRLRNPRLLRMRHEFSYGAFRSDFDAAPGRMARAGLRHLYGEDPILIRTMGGSIPIAPFVEALELPAAIVPTVNIDNNQHSPNENLRLGNFIEGIAMIMSVLGREP